MGWYTKQELNTNGRTYTMPRIGAIVRDSLVVLALVTVAGMYGCPRYKVWEQGLEGEAALKKAEQTRRVTVLEAQAKKDAATMLAEAEVERAKGVAEANRIISDSLQGHQEYLQYLWIDKVAENASREIIYVPTEASLPILESQRLSQKPTEAK